jgi:hypothetical protein
MRRREFISLLGDVAAWPLAARSQQASMPTIGLLGSTSHREWPNFVAALRQGLNESAHG